MLQRRGESVLESAIQRGYMETTRLFQLNRLDEALSACLSLLKKVPTNSAVLNLAGSILFRKRLYSEAESVLTTAHDIAPETEEIALNLVRVLKKTESAGRARAVLEKSLEFKPSSGLLLSTLGEIHYFSKRFELAGAFFEKALASDPDNPELLFRLACAQQAFDSIENAFKTYHRLLEIQPDHAEACVNLGHLYKSFGDYDEAMELFHRAADLEPDNPLYASMSLFCLNYGFTSRAEHLERATAWAKRHADHKMPTMPVVARPAQGRIRVGFVSADFSMHPVGRLLLPILKRIDPDRFEIHCFSNVSMEDELTREFREAVPGFHDIRDMDDAMAQHLIRHIGIDILIDLAGHTGANRLGVMAGKPAPVQMMWLGYFNTTGMQAMDYVLADWTNVPQGHGQFYREEVLRLPDSFFPYVMPEGVVIPPREAGDGVVYGCFNDSAKINDDVLSAWNSILDGVPGSRLVLKSRTLSDSWVRERFLERARRQGMDAERIAFLGPSGFHEYLHEYSKVDICLDPFPYSGGATTGDALFAGRPVLTCPFENFASRMSASILRTCGLDDLICDGLDDYIRKAILLGTDPGELASANSLVAERFRESKLCDIDRFARSLESTLLSLVE